MPAGTGVGAIMTTLNKILAIAGVDGNGQRDARLEAERSARVWSRGSLRYLPHPRIFAPGSLSWRGPAATIA